MPKMSKQTASKRSSGEVVIPDRLYFRIGEVSRLCGLPAYVLRFWESEFPQLKPRKGSSGQRSYRRVDLDNILRIKKLLYDEGFTIAGARQQMRVETKNRQNALPFVAPSSANGSDLKHVRQGLRELLGILSSRRPAG